MTKANTIVHHLSLRLEYRAEELVVVLLLEAVEPMKRRQYSYGVKVLSAKFHRCGVPRVFCSSCKEMPKRRMC